MVDGEYDVAVGAMNGIGVERQSLGCFSAHAAIPILILGEGIPLLDRSEETDLMHIGCSVKESVREIFCARCKCDRLCRREGKRHIFKSFAAIECDLLHFTVFKSAFIDQTYIEGNDEILDRAIQECLLANVFQTIVQINLFEMCAKREGAITDAADRMRKVQRFRQGTSEKGFAGNQLRVGVDHEGLDKGRIRLDEQKVRIGCAGKVVCVLIEREDVQILKIESIFAHTAERGRENDLFHRQAVIKCLCADRYQTFGKAYVNQHTAGMEGSISDRDQRRREIEIFQGAFFISAVANSSEAAWESDRLQRGTAVKGLIADLGERFRKCDVGKRNTAAKDSGR